MTEEKKIESMARLLEGNGLFVSDPRSTVVGNECIITADAHDCIVIGNANRIYGARCSVFGNGNFLFAMPEKVEGFGNTVTLSDHSSSSSSSSAPSSSSSSSTTASASSSATSPLPATARASRRRERSRSPIRSADAAQPTRTRSRSPRPAVPSSSRSSSGSSSTPRTAPRLRLTAVSASPVSTLEVHHGSHLSSALSALLWRHLIHQTFGAMEDDDPPSPPPAAASEPRTESMRVESIRQLEKEAQNSKPATSGTCSICMVMAIQVVPLPCKHAYACAGCFRKQQRATANTTKGLRCAICNQQIKDHVVMHLNGCGTDVPAEAPVAATAPASTSSSSSSSSTSAAS